ncbi:chromodomain helicase DNA binding protein [Blastocystis sp. subtype 4]|uniref:chromodomain helicase DNA binding protein n=1 Tax=Blastocystis sp. subtype 4 TaxID=944170 RepID=UPI000711BAF0|nr:chromodomain helicase DNA binding protein [Blastocystis sp. subtype 4]KNB43806.1 chromodomain helicase DNA binding protein [Blastocystis sp. subtype 4]|eukprot:XP_014527249.1 chromodomain helicase DNA binding protein [Blastocystis sp. subtype 4]
MQSNGVEFDKWIGTAISPEDIVPLYSSHDYCCICKMPGNLLLCDGPCKRAFHFRCLKIRKSDVGEGDWFCDDCLHGRPISESIYVKHSDDIQNILSGNSLVVYRFLKRAVKESLSDISEPSFSPYSSIQLLLVLVEIAQTSRPPLRFSIFQLIQNLIEKLSFLVEQPLSITSLNDFQNCLDLLQLIDVLEKTGTCTDLKRQVVNELNSIRICQQSLLQMIPQTNDKMVISSSIRLLLLSSYLFHRNGIHSPIGVDDAIDLTLS